MGLCKNISNSFDTLVTGRKQLKCNPFVSIALYSSSGRTVTFLSKQKNEYKKAVDMMRERKREREMNYRWCVK